MRHPFEALPGSKRRVVFLTLAAATIVLLSVLIGLYGPLKNEAAPQGMVSVELAWTPERLARMLASWDEETRMRLAFSLGLNFLCLFALSNTLAMACVWTASAMGGGLATRAGILLGWGQWAAGAVWAVQNSLLAAALLGYCTTLTMALSSSFALVKFTLFSAGLFFAVLAGIRLASRRPNKLER